MVLVYIYTPLPSNYYVTWVKNDTHFELQVLILAPYLAQYKNLKKKNTHLFSHVFYPKLVSSIQMPSRIFFFRHEKSNHWRASRAVTAPRCYFTNACEKQVLVSTRLSWRIIGPLAQPSPPLPQSCSPPLCPCPVLDRPDPDERKSCEQI